jgi:hypothetical protein
MTMSFKIGDIVECVVKQPEILVGYAYQVEDVSPRYNQVYLSGYSMPYPFEAFKPVPAVPPVAEGGGLKYDEGKPDLSYISYEFLKEMALVREFGAKKYERDNWKKGFKITRSLAAALRHIYMFLAGETFDKESGRLHLAHAACCLEHAIYDLHYHPENDDRGTKLDEVAE